MLGHLIYDHAHLDDVKIQQEISKSLYTKYFGEVFLVHAYNGKKTWGYKQYLEDKLITIKNRGHYQGAVDLINSGLKYFTDKNIPGLRYVLVTAADTWLLKPEFLKKVIGEMQKNGQVLAACSWHRTKTPELPKGFSTDFFIIDLEWNKKSKLFPLDFGKFSKDHSDYFALNYGIPTVEAAVQFNYFKYFTKRFKDNAIWMNANNSFRRIVERDPVHYKNFKRHYDWPNIGLYSQPSAYSKQKTLKKLKADFGPETKKLMDAKNLNYYNSV